MVLLIQQSKMEYVTTATTVHSMLAYMAFFKINFHIAQLLLTQLKKYNKFTQVHQHI